VTDADRGTGNVGVCDSVCECRSSTHGLPSCQGATGFVCGEHRGTLLQLTCDTGSPAAGALNSNTRNTATLMTQ
jgi:hypothetical protein